MLAVYARCPFLVAGRMSSHPSVMTIENITATKATLEHLKAYVQTQLQGTPIRSQVNQFIESGSSSAGIRAEEIFTREFLCPALAKYFYKHVRAELNLSDEQIRRGLGTEGYQRCPGFGFSPARKRKHLFTKFDIVTNTAPATWLVGNEKKLSPFQACPDFAIASPLPISTIGETKYFLRRSVAEAVKDLYDAARQAVFYLGAFAGDYHSAMIVVADASPEHSFHAALDSLKPELLGRFGPETNVHLVPIRVV